MNRQLARAPLSRHQHCSTWSQPAACSPGRALPLLTLFGGTALPLVRGRRRGHRRTGWRRQQAYPTQQRQWLLANQHRLGDHVQDWPVKTLSYAFYECRDYGSMLMLTSGWRPGVQHSPSLPEPRHAPRRRLLPLHVATAGTCRHLREEMPHVATVRRQFK